MKANVCLVAVVCCVLRSSQTALATENTSTSTPSSVAPTPACPANSSSVGVNTSCACDAGYSGPDGGPCEACAAGDFKAQAGSAPCGSCEMYGKNRYWVIPASAYMTHNYRNDFLREGLHTSRGLGATACESCAANASKDNDDQCECMPGYYQTVRRTVEDEVNMFQVPTPPYSGLDQCVQCPEHTYKNASGLKTCVNVESWTDDYDDTCAWYEWQSAGGAGSWPVGGCYYTGTATTASQVAFAACCVCHDRSSIVAQVALYNPLSISLFTGSSRWEASQCTACPVNSVAPGTGHASISACRCAVGHSGPDGGACQACSAGHYKDTIGSAECTACPSTLSSPSGSSALSSCQCPVGHSGPEAGPCAACAAGLYKTALASGTCVSCSASTYSATAGASTCTDCGPGMYHTTTGASASSVCFKCETGKYRDNRHATLTCGGTCASGCSPTSGALSGTISDGTGSYSNFENCWWLLAASPGVEIRMSFLEFKTERGYDFVTISQCSDAACSIHTQILKHSGRMSASSVYASTTGFLKVVLTSDYSRTDDGVIGNWSLSGTDVCIGCRAGKYSAALGASTADACLSCPESSSSLSGSSLATDCRCNSGYSGADGDPCAACAAGKYKSDIGANPCTTCAVGKYSAREGAGTCSRCPAFSSSPSGSRFVNDCKCNAGHSGADGGPCTAVLPEMSTNSVHHYHQHADSTSAWLVGLACAAVVCIALGFVCTRTRVSTADAVRL